MSSVAFLCQRWPKKHAYVLEEARALDVRDVLPQLNAFQRKILRTWHPPTYPQLSLVSQRGGPFTRWWFECPTCERRCESLFIPPNVDGEEWACRLCCSLVYAVQRYGRRHPLRRKPTRRKEITQRKRAARAARQRAREVARFRTASGVTGDDVLIISYSPLDGCDGQRPATTARWMSRAELEAEQRARTAGVEAARALLEAERPRSIAFLQAVAQTAPRKRDRVRAERTLAREDRRSRQPRLRRAAQRPRRTAQVAGSPPVWLRQT